MIEKCLQDPPLEAIVDDLARRSDESGSARRSSVALLARA